RNGHDQPIGRYRRAHRRRRAAAQIPARCAQRRGWAQQRQHAYHPAPRLGADDPPRRGPRTHLSLDLRQYGKADDAAVRRPRRLRMRHSIGEDSVPYGNSPRLALVTTTIRVPEVLRLYRALAPEIAIFIVGDRRSPHAEIRTLAREIDAVYLSDEDQIALGHQCCE